MADPAAPPAAKPAAETPPAPQPPSPTPPTPTPPTPPASEPGDEGGRVPRERLNKVLEEKKAAEEERDRLKKEAEERAAADLSDKEKAERKAEQAEQRAKDAETKATELERSGWVRDAAQAESFTDPADAVAFLTLSELEDEEAATKAVKELAEKKPHLVGAAAGGGRPQAFGRPAGGTASPPASEGGKDDGGKTEAGSDILRLITGRRPPA